MSNRTPIYVTPVPPKPPNFLHIEEVEIAGTNGKGEDRTLPLSAFSDAALRRLGKEWTESLVRRAREMRDTGDETREPGLLPCPFCGLEPYLKEPHFRGDNFQVGCDCGADSEEEEEGVGSIWRNSQTFEEVAERWNRRAAIGTCNADAKRVAFEFVVEHPEDLPAGLPALIHRLSLKIESEEPDEHLARFLLPALEEFYDGGTVRLLGPDLEEVSP